MANMKVSFASCVHDSQDYGSDNQYMVSRVFFSITYEDHLHTGLYADIKQPVDGNVETDPLEITGPHGYDGPISWEGFRRAVGQYYRSLVGSCSSGFQTRVDNIRMRDHSFLLPRTFEFPVVDVSRDVLLNRNASLTTDREVTHTCKDDDGDIAALCNPRASWSPRSRHDVISDIDDRLHTYYLTMGNRLVDIVIVPGPKGKCLRSPLNETATNELNGLPDCL